MILLLCMAMASPILAGPVSLSIFPTGQVQSHSEVTIICTAKTADGWSPPSDLYDILSTNGAVNYTYESVFDNSSKYSIYENPRVTGYTMDDGFSVVISNLTADDNGAQFVCAAARVGTSDVVTLDVVDNSDGQPWIPGSASQSSTYLDRTADLGIDGDEDTKAETLSLTGLHWWLASMSNTVVDQIKLKAYTVRPTGMINVSLYFSDSLVGTCDSHSGALRWETLNCTTGPLGLTADMVKVMHTSTSATWLEVYEIEILPGTSPVPTTTAPTTTAPITNGTTAPTNGTAAPTPYTGEGEVRVKFGGAQVNINVPGFDAVEELDDVVEVVVETLHEVMMTPYRAIYCLIHRC